MVQLSHLNSIIQQEDTVIEWTAINEARIEGYRESQLILVVRERKREGGGVATDSSHCQMYCVEV